MEARVRVPPPSIPNTTPIEMKKLLSVSLLCSAIAQSSGQHV
jgi:hypothetical protein